jgi:hypothetical protein
MVDLGIAVTWLAISAASIKGLSAFARVAAINGCEAELALTAGHESAHDGPPSISMPAHRPGVRP